MDYKTTINYPNATLYPTDNPDVFTGTRERNGRLQNIRVNLSYSGTQYPDNDTELFTIKVETTVYQEWGSTTP